MSIKNDGHYFCGAGGNRPDGSDEALTVFSEDGQYDLCSGVHNITTFWNKRCGNQFPIWTTFSHTKDGMSFLH
ncbi:hypothetical protein BTM80_13735 [Salmonella enterica]|nr:hypothetical protein [Salmonella enterica]EDR3611381.1 hypothetical protein [Salmonella enterica subsp. enterica serovar Weltevreden]EBA5861307.1 hypothetical protein [Salmonella enterica]EBQ5709555.1 hypothetical protein [Salmonella enterica]EBR1064923.1 hypothetical protein [Salmonella enterica]